MSYKDLEDPKQQSDGTWAVQYVTKDESGKVIGTTTLSGATEREVWKKIQAAHVESTAAIARLRKKQVVYKPGTFTEPEQEAIKANILAKKAIEERESYFFLKAHAYAQDYNTCEGNSQLMADFLDSHGLEWTAQNLEIAFSKLTEEGRLAPPAVARVENVEVPVEVAVEPVKVPWRPNPITPESLAAMPLDEYKSYLSSKNLEIRNEFVKQVAEAADAKSYRTGRL
jgi:hypothetical protein